MIRIYFICIFTFLFSKPIPTTLEDYAYDFSLIGYEIEFPATSGYFSAMNAGDYFKAYDKGYSIKVRIERLSRNSRKDFISFYNENCKDDFVNDVCPMIVSGAILSALITLGYRLFRSIDPIHLCTPFLGKATYAPAAAVVPSSCFRLLGT